MTVIDAPTDLGGVAADVIPPPPAVIIPAVLGPTWARDERGEFILPTCEECEDARLLDPDLICRHRSLGWAVIDWQEDELTGPDGQPWRLTDEQCRFILWWYAIDEDGGLVYDSGVLQRIKGWGKDPLLAALCLTELVGPCRFAGWDDDGEPIVVPEPMAWVQVAATRRSQTSTTMKVFQWMCGEAFRRAYGVEVFATQVTAPGGRKVEGLSRSPQGLEGARSTFVVLNETQHWHASNQGYEMEEVIERNLTKGEGGTARGLAITNAYSPNEDSVAQRTREAWESTPVEHRTHQLYDSLEAPEDALLHPDWVPVVLAAVRGDSVWLDIPRITRSVLNRKTPVALSRRFWYNMITVTETALLTPKLVNGSARPELGEGLIHDLDMTAVRALEGQWVLGFDGGKSDDSTALMGCRLADGHLVTLGVWEKPKGADETWRAPRGEVSERIDEVHAKLEIVAFFGDPSHTKDDLDDSQRYWDAVLDDAHRKHGGSYWVQATTTGHRKHSIEWDMTAPSRQADFGAAVELFLQEIRDGEVTHDGHSTLKRHMLNAQRYPVFVLGRRYVSMSKVSRESPRKIDLAVAAVIARMLRRSVLNAPVASESSGEWW